MTASNGGTVTVISTSQDQEEGGGPHLGPTLPVDFPDELLLRICDNILQPALNASSPLRPHVRPWHRTVPARAPCKSDFLAFCYSNRRVYTTCVEYLYRHIRVANLSVADMLVSRRNLLKNTEVLEFFISREQDITQAQTDLNHNRFWIQCSIILLWSPAVRDVLLDIKGVCEPAPFKSFFERFSQRAYIKAGSNREEEDNNPAGVVPRWNDSQGILNCRTRVSIPKLTLGISTKTVGELPHGLLSIVEAACPILPKGATTGMFGSRLPSWARRLPTHVPDLTTIVHLDLLIPRPHWGQEDAEGTALGHALTRLVKLKRLGLHANAEFSIRRHTFVLPTVVDTPRYQQQQQQEEPEEGEADIEITPSGAVLSNSTTTNTQSGGNASISNTSGGGGGSGATFIMSSDGTDSGPETWWSRVLAQLCVALDDLEELTISARGYIESSHFDSFFGTVAAPLARFSSLKVIVFDIEAALKEGYSSPDDRPLRQYYWYQRNWVLRLLSPGVTAYFKPPLPPPNNPAENPDWASALRRVYFGEYNGFPGYNEFIGGNRRSKRSGSTAAGSMTKVDKQRSRQNNLGSGTAAGPNGSAGGGEGNGLGKQQQSKGYGIDEMVLDAENPMGSGERLLPGMWWSMGPGCDGVLQGWVTCEDDEDLGGVGY